VKKKKLLVTGLCLSRNRGGAAMALSFVDLIQKYLPIEIIFAVDPNHMELEQMMARYYGVDVAGCDTLLTWLTTHPAIQPLARSFLQKRLRTSSGNYSQYIRTWQNIHRKYQEIIKKVNCIVNLNGVAFIGDGTRSWHTSLSHRTCSIYAHKHQKPFFRFIQSYGPFLDWRVRKIAQMEFRRLPCIMARGEISATYCRDIAGNIPVYGFPDVAVTLPCADNSWLVEYLRGLNLSFGDYVVLSPSSIINTIPAKKHTATGHKHVWLYAEIAKYYLSKGRPILFVPHATSPESSRCDRAVSKKCIKILTKDDRYQPSLCSVVEDELDCRELKSLISGAKLAVVSRYHALVAALSTGVASVAVGWNDKYLDIMNYYDCGEFVVDARMGGIEAVTDAVLQRCRCWSKEQRDVLKQRQPYLEKMVMTAGRMCADWITAVT
jgi:polysaccharide pyruvyl transferase WcaK-like protein